jgi:hypothetical protein
MRRLLVAALLLTACAPLKDPWGLAVRRGITIDGEVQPPNLPDSLQADLAITPREPGLVPFSVRLYARPNRAYRIDAFGFPSVIAASYLWLDGRWMWIRHDNKQVWEGVGNEFQVEDSPLRLPDVHAVLGFLWGRSLPGFIEKDSLLAPGPAGEVRWMYHGALWEARMDPATGLCREVRSASLRMTYRSHERRSGRVVPLETEVFIDGASVMVMRIRELKDAPVWRRNPFMLAAPAGYARPLVAP